MKVLNLIRLEKSDIKYEIIQFPDGEPHIVLKDINRKEDISVLCRITNPKDLFILMQVGDILNRQGVKFELNITYLMSMRMDRVISYDEAYSLKVITDVINHMSPFAVHVLEPHSKKVSELIHNYWGDLIITTPDFDEYLLAYPDEGAMKRYADNNSNVLLSSKVRDLETGKLVELKIENPEILLADNCPILVVDDLCDGGSTFVKLAVEIRKIDPKRKLSIYVTHMVNPKGIIALSENYDEVYFTNSYKDWQLEVLPENVKVIEIV